MTTKLHIKVSPGAAGTAVTGWMGDRLKIRVSAAPEKGKANKAVIELLSNILDIPASAISVCKGNTSSNKTIALEGLSSEELFRRLPSGD